ncbi:hypothetical protein BDK51DRAFT_31644 [Blyttiomyces helicus]|uniref:Galactose oxidase n=1 Tax=Blyttiomyces helicus TaxID=388810 RepID=A0A4P9WE82_9FUNG|nr:hypothetical protein BDK51DRAFT_31644 [Blyttiomyces helicus]|eukprot:RKO90075.1 hypothetical protein BDK51DRAFT_31644 [Blyttiomyces helicus]
MISTLNLTSYTWTSSPPTRIPPRMGANFIACGTTAYIFGGQDSLPSSDPSTPILHYSDLHSIPLNPRGTASTPVLVAARGTPPAPRWRACAGILADGSVLVHGGERVGPLSEGEVFADSFVFDPASNTWTDVTSPTSTPGARAAPACASVGGDVYLFGGLGPPSTVMGEGIATSDLWRFSSVDKTWVQITAKGVAPTARFGAAGAEFGDSFVVSGTGDVSNPDPRFYIYNISTGTWAPTIPSSADKPQANFAPPSFMIASSNTTSPVIGSSSQSSGLSEGAYIAMGFAAGIVIVAIAIFITEIIQHHKFMAALQPPANVNHTVIRIDPDAREVAWSISDSNTAMSSTDRLRPSTSIYAAAPVASAALPYPHRASFSSESLAPRTCGIPLSPPPRPAATISFFPHHLAFEAPSAVDRNAEYPAGFTRPPPDAPLLTAIGNYVPEWDNEIPVCIGDSILIE